MPDTRPFLLPVTIVVAGVEYQGTWDQEGDAITVYLGVDSMRVELDGAVAKRRAEDVLRGLVKRRPRR